MEVCSQLHSTAALPPRWVWGHHCWSRWYREESSLYHWMYRASLCYLLETAPCSRWSYSLTFHFMWVVTQPSLSLRGVLPVLLLPFSSGMKNKLVTAYLCESVFKTLHQAHFPWLPPTPTWNCIYQFNQTSAYWLQHAPCHRSLVCNIVSDLYDLHYLPWVSLISLDG